MCTKLCAGSEDGGVKAPPTALYTASSDPGTAYLGFHPFSIFFNWIHIYLDAKKHAWIKHVEPFDAYLMPICVCHEIASGQST